MCVHAFTRRERERESQFKKESEKKKVKPARGEKREEKREIFEKSEREKRKRLESNFRAQSFKRNETRACFERKERKKRASASSSRIRTRAAMSAFILGVCVLITFCFDDDVFLEVSKSLSHKKKMKRGESRRDFWS